MGQNDQGYQVSAGRATLEEYLNQWLVRQQSRLKPSTITDYRRNIQNRLIPEFGKTRLGVHQVLHVALGDAVQERLLGYNPADGVIRPHYTHEEMQILDESQVGQFLLAARGNRYEALYWLAAKYGLRQGELLGLKWNDVDWKRGTLRVIRQAKFLPHLGWTFPEPKTQAGRRTIQLGESTLHALMVHRDRQQQEKDMVGERWQELGLVFPSEVGTPVHHTNLLRNYKALLKRAGLPRIRFHDLRHTAASLMLINGIPAIVVSKILGHAKPSTTTNLYEHLVPDGQQAAAKVIDEIATPIPISFEPTPLVDQPSEQHLQISRNDKHG